MQIPQASGGPEEKTTTTALEPIGRAGDRKAGDRRRLASRWLPPLLARASFGFAQYCADFHQDTIDLSGFDLLQKFLQSRTFQVGATEAAVIMSMSWLSFREENYTSMDALSGSESKSGGALKPTPESHPGPSPRVRLKLVRDWQIVLFFSCLWEPPEG